MIYLDKRLYSYKFRAGLLNRLFLLISIENAAFYLILFLDKRKPK